MHIERAAFFCLFQLWFGGGKERKGFEHEKEFQLRERKRKEREGKEKNKNREKKCNLGNFLINPKKNVERYNILKSKKTITIMNEYKYGSFLR